jgi:flagellar motor protein MotB
MPKCISKTVLIRGTGLVAAGLLLSACSQVPDAVNPVEWYNSTVGFFSGDDNDKQAKDQANAKTDAKAAPGADKKFPKLTRVNQQADYQAARKQGGLVADVEGRQYAPAIARQGEPATRLAAAPPEPPKASAGAPQQPAPAAGSKPAVTQGQLLASAPASPTLGGGLPTTAEQQAFEARLRKQLAEIQARAGQSGPALAPLSGGIMASFAPDDFGTVVVSSSGIEQGSQSAAMAVAPQGQKFSVAPSVSVASQSGGLSYLERQPRPLGAGAVRVATIQFNNGSARLTASDRQILTNVRQLQRERGGRIHIIGHASSRTRSMDPVRHKMVNFRVSVDRANIIARELVRMGFKKEQLVVDAVSDTEPMYFEFMPTGEAGNRRAEIYLES